MVVCSPPQLRWDITIHPIQDPTSSLTLFSSSNRCGIAPKSSPPQPMWDITIHPLGPPQILSFPTNVGHHNPPLQDPTSLLALFPSSNRCEITSKSTPLWAQRHYWHTASCLPHSGNNEKADTSSGIWLWYHL